MLKSGNVLLRPFSSKNLMSREYLSWMNDRDVVRTIGRFDYLFPVTRAKLVRYVNDIDPETQVFLAIYRRRDRSRSQFVGTLKIYDMDYLARRASLGILIGDKSAWGSGLASSAIDAACSYIFAELGLNKVSAGYMSSNKGMHRAFEKNGFVIEGVLKGHLYLSGDLADHVLVAKFRGSSS